MGCRSLRDPRMTKSRWTDMGALYGDYTASDQLPERSVGVTDPMSIGAHGCLPIRVLGLIAISTNY
jgi:hypothetical protein